MEGTRGTNSFGGRGETPWPEIGEVAEAAATKMSRRWRSIAVWIVPANAFPALLSPEGPLASARITHIPYRLSTLVHNGRLIKNGCSQAMARKKSRMTKFDGGRGVEAWLLGEPMVIDTSRSSMGGKPVTNS